MNQYIVRWAKKEDCVSIRSMIQELADYEEMSDGPKISAEKLEQDGFGENLYFKAFMVEQVETGISVGYALFFNYYSTWNGKAIYLEDLYIQEKFRGKGLTTAIMSALSAYVIKNDFAAIFLSCLKWNTSAKVVYDHFNFENVTESEQWERFHLNKSAVKELSEKKLRDNVEIGYY